MKVYIAGGWFNLFQIEAITDIEAACTAVEGIEAFSPRKDNLGTPDMDDDGWTDTYNHNLKAIEDCDFIIASTVDKDMGTLFECGYAAAKGKDIIYYSPGLNGDFNLMLAKSAHSICTNLTCLYEVIRKYPNKVMQFEGGIE